jgi:hypothetical protein
MIDVRQSAQCVLPSARRCVKSRARGPFWLFHTCLLSGYFLATLVIGPRNATTEQSGVMFFCQTRLS